MGATVTTNENYNTNGSNDAYISLETLEASAQPQFNATSTNTGTGNFNITELRAALVKQHFNELMARGGDRYYEKLLTL